MNASTAATPEPGQSGPGRAGRDGRRSDDAQEDGPGPADTDLEPGRRAYGFRQTFPAAPSSVGKARHFVRRTLSDIGIVADDATLAVSEMVTVALTSAADGDRIEVALRLRGGEIDIEVCSPHGRDELTDVQAAVISAVADFYERREVGDVDVQSFGCLVRTQPARRADDRSN